MLQLEMNEKAQEERKKLELQKAKEMENPSEQQADSILNEGKDEDIVVD